MLIKRLFLHYHHHHHHHHHSQVRRAICKSTKSMQFSTDGCLSLQMFPYIQSFFNAATAQFETLDWSSTNMTCYRYHLWAGLDRVWFSWPCAGNPDDHSQSLLTAMISRQRLVLAPFISCLLHNMGSFSVLCIVSSAGNLFKYYRRASTEYQVHVAVSETSNWNFLLWLYRYWFSKLL